MRTHITKRTLLAMTGLAAVLAAAPIAAQAAPPTIITGHHDNNLHTTGYTLGSGSYSITDPSPDPAMPGTTFNTNKTDGLEAGGGTMVTVEGGQFNSNRQNGMLVQASPITIHGGQFHGNGEDGLMISGLGSPSGLITISTINVTDGQFTGNGIGLDLYDSSATVSGGQFTGNTTGLCYEDEGSAMGAHEDHPTSVTISGGTFSGNKYGVVADYGAKITITGGTFSGNTEAEMQADGGTITLTGNFRQSAVPSPHTLIGTLTSPNGQFDVLFPGSTQWQTLWYETRNGGKIVLLPNPMKILSPKSGHGLPSNPVVLPPKGSGNGIR